MAQITINLESTDLTPETAIILNELLQKLTGSTTAAPVAPKQAKPDTKPAKSEKPTTASVETPKEAEPEKAEEPKQEAPAPEATAAEAPNKTDVRALALKLSKAGKQDAIKTIFAKYGADKLSGVPEKDYPELMKDLVAANE